MEGKKMSGESEKKSERKKQELEEAQEELAARKGKADELTKLLSEMACNDREYAHDGFLDEIAREIISVSKDLLAGDLTEITFVVTRKAAEERFVDKQLRVSLATICGQRNDLGRYDRLTLLETYGQDVSRLPDVLYTEMGSCTNQTERFALVRAYERSEFLQGIALAEYQRYIGEEGDLPFRIMMMQMASDVTTFIADQNRRINSYRLLK